MKNYKHFIKTIFTIKSKLKKKKKLGKDFLGGLGAESCLTLATPWTVARQAPLSMGFSRQEHWSGLPFHDTKSMIHKK